MMAHFEDRQNRVAVTREERPTKGYQTVDLLIGIEVYNGITLRFGIENIFDGQYVYHLNANNTFAGVPIARFTGERIPEPGIVFNLDVNFRV